MPKTLLISQEPPPHKGGSAIILYRLFKMFPEKSYVVLSLYSSFYEPSLLEPKTKLSSKYYYSTGIYAGKPYTRWIALLEWVLVPFMLVKCLDVVRKEKINRILVHPTTGTFLLTAYLAHKITKIPLYIYMFDLFEEKMLTHLRRVLAGPIERLAMCSAANVFVMSEAMQDHYHDKYNNIMTVLIPHPIELNGFYGQEGNKVQNDAKYKILLTAGMIYDVHIDSIVNLVKAIKGMPEIEFDLYTRNTEEYFKKFGIEGTNIIYHKRVDSKYIPVIQRRADILFLPMAFNSPYPEIIKTASPVKLPEYLASDVPILVHAPPDAYISWYARKYEWGLVVDKPEPALLKDAIMKLIRDKKLQQGLVNSARKTVLLHDLNHVVEIFKKGLGLTTL